MIAEPLVCVCVRVLGNLMCTRYSAPLIFFNEGSTHPRKREKTENILTEKSSHPDKWTHWISTKLATKHGSWGYLVVVRKWGVGGLGSTPLWNGWYIYMTFYMANFNFHFINQYNFHCQELLLFRWAMRPKCLYLASSCGIVLPGLHVVSK